jgi:cell division protein FtsB
MNELVAELFKGIDQKLISEEVKAKVVEMIGKTVDARVDAKTNDVQARNKVLAEENAKLVAEMAQLKKDVEEKEAFLKEAAYDLGRNMSAEYAEKEAILFETVKEYQEPLLTTAQCLRVRLSQPQKNTRLSLSPPRRKLPLNSRKCVRKPTHKR